MGKGLNSAVAKSQLAKNMAASIKKADTSRWLSTEEGMAKLQEIELKKKIDAIRVDLKVGQLVWREVIAEDDNDFMSNGLVINRCCKIVEIKEDGTVDSEMLYVMRDGQKYDAYVDTWGVDNRKGEIFNNEIIKLEKHIAKTTGSFWWKVK
jgi:hypothetical protein